MKLQLKDRIYILKTKTTPLSFMLASRNTGRHPLMHFDEEKQVNRALRYARNQKSPFEDEQDDNAILEPVVFEDGFLTVPKNNPVLQWFLSLHPGFGKIFEEVNTERDAADDVESMDIELDAEIAAKEMSIEMAESIARVLMGSRADRLSSAELKRDVRLYARNNPVEFLEMLVYFNLKDNKKKMMTVPFGEEPVSALAAYLQTDEGIEVMKMLEKKLK